MVILIIKTLKIEKIFSFGIAQKNCNKKANFNIASKTNPIYCKDHKKKNMIHTTNKRCKEKNCNTIKF